MGRGLNASRAAPGLKNRQPKFSAIFMSLQRCKSGFWTMLMATVVVQALMASWLSAEIASSSPTVEQFFSSHALPEPLVPVGSNPTPEQNQALKVMLDAFQGRGQGDDFSSLEGLLAADPKSPWRMAVLTNLGLLYYHAGYYSKCIPAYHDAWEIGKNATDLRAKALADRAAGEYTKMLARLGRYPELKAFLVEIGDRKFIGQAAQLILAGKEGVVDMETRPDISFRCGPFALSRILAAQNSSHRADPAIMQARSTMQGMSLNEVADISQKVGLNYQVAKRAPGAPLIMPSVIHWKVGHYAALLKQVGNRYLTQDPTFENETWHTLNALEAEASGYFLVPPGPLPAGWTSVSAAEAGTIFGKGDTGGPQPIPRPHDPKTPMPMSPLPTPPSPFPGPTPNNGPTCPGPGMAVSSFRIMLASVEVNDTPVGYRPPYGNPVYFTANYVQRNPSQPSNFNYSNLGPQWDFSWQKYMVDDPANPASVSQYLSDGAYVTYSYLGSNGSNYTYGVQFDSFNQLTRPTSGLPYTVTNPDGSKEIYGKSDGSTAAPRKVFLTQFIDSAGNATTLAYDSQLRLTTVTDALGQVTTLSYGLASDVYKITKVTDPFGRYATFSYDSSGRLSQIQDVIGIQSNFGYDGTGDFLNTLTTPYGTSTFTVTDNGTVRRVTATNPLGDTEVLESNYNASSAVADTEMLAPTGMNAENIYLEFRNSFYWDRKAWKEAPNDYSKAYLYHWLHDFNQSQTAGYLESEKPPLQNRIWYSYPGQPGGNVVGTSSVPAFVGRVTESGNEVTAISSTPLGKLSSQTDPLGRKTSYNYSLDGIDLMSVTHSQGTGTVTLATYTYNSQHRPLTYTDAAGQTTQYVWNSVGQPSSITDALTEATSFTYYPANTSGHQRNGHLYQIVGPVPANANYTNITAFDYDTTGDVYSVTGPDGYNLTFTHDALDRLTKVTFPDTTYMETVYQWLDPLTTRDRLGRFTHFVYNGIRQLTSVTDPLNRQVQYVWCKCGDLQQLIDPMNRITTWHRDIEGRVYSKVYDDGSMIQYEYEPYSGRLSRITDEQNQYKTRTYNVDGTLAGITYINAVHSTPNVSYTYDPDYQRITQMVDGIGKTAYTYNAIASGTLGAGQLAGVDGPLPNDTLAYSYDALGRNTGYAINGVGESRTFDAIGRLLTVTNPLGNFGYTFVGATGRMNAVTYPNGMTCGYNYFPLTGDFRLKDIIYTLSGSTQLSQYSYQYNVVGDVTRWTQISPQANLNRSWLCSYDAGDQLTSVASQDPTTLANQTTGQYSYSFDPAGNRLTETIDGSTTTASYNALNQLTSLSNATASPVPQQTYEWDAENRLTAINYPGTSQRSEFQFDGGGRRVRITEKNGSTITSDLCYVWRGFQVAEERDSTGSSVQRRYFARGMQIAQSGGSLALRMFSRDHLGSVRALMSSAGVLTGAYDYDPWGRRLVSAGQSDESSLAFTGHWFHAVSGLTEAPLRSYNQNIGKWLSRDPLGIYPDLNLYRYVFDNPVTHFDLLGLECDCNSLPLYERYDCLAKNGGGPDDGADYNKAENDARRAAQAAQVTANIAANASIPTDPEGAAEWLAGQLGGLAANHGQH